MNSREIHSWDAEGVYEKVDKECRVVVGMLGMPKIGSLAVWRSNASHHRKLPKRVTSSRSPLEAMSSIVQHLHAIAVDN